VETQSFFMRAKTRMVKKENIENRILFICEVCGLGYIDEQTAAQCEDWCRRTGTCNVKLTSRAVYFPGLTRFPRKQE